MHFASMVAQFNIPSAVGAIKVGTRNNNNHGDTNGVIESEGKIERAADGEKKGKCE